MTTKYEDEPGGPRMNRAAIFRTGDSVLIECAGTTVRGTVMLASGNGRSLMLSFDAVFDGHVGMMPVLQDEDGGAFRSIMTGTAVALRAMH